MKRIVFAAAAVLAAMLAANPAAATQGLHCRAAAGGGPTIDVVSSAQLIGVSVSERGITRSTMVPDADIAPRQSWFDEERVWIDLWNPRTMTDEGKLRLHYAGRGAGRHLVGTFVRAGRLTRLRCEES
ncbi:MAG TPA: hypothetical protein VGB79_15860 [Allosphingosinicella sp.]|jgi:hypothetical protein